MSLVLVMVDGNNNESDNDLQHFNKNIQDCTSILVAVSAQFVI